MQDYTTGTMRAYDRMFRAYIRKNKGFAKKYLLADIKKFLEGLPGTRVLDLGSGDGETAALFKHYGFHPVCVDISQRMVKEAQSRGLEAHQMDFGFLGFPNEYFAGVWANLSLMHAPKYRMPLLLYEVWRVLEDGGKFYVSLFEGEGEGWFKKGALAPVMRYYAFYNETEFQEMLQCNGFKVIHRSRLHLPHKDPALLFLTERA